MTFTSSISLETAALISTVLEGILYGFSVLMFIGTMWSMSYKRSMRDVNRPVAAAAVLLSVLSTAHIVLSIIRIEYGFVTYQGVPAAYFADVSQETYVIKNSIYVLQTLLGDAVAIYRCYVVWQAAWVIILPSLLWCGVAVTGALYVYGDSQTSSTGIISTTVNVECMGVFCVLTLLANLSSSGLLAYRIWKIERNVSSSRTSKVMTTSIIRVVMDSASLYTIALLATVTGALCSSNGPFTLIDTLTPVISIAFYMVIIRIAIGQNAHSQVLTVRGGITSETERGSFPQYSVKPLQVNTPRSTHTDSTRVYGTSSWNQSRPPTGKEYLDETSCDLLSG
ncbi:hypothetical protein DFJ58DRAFT_684760 [Suillus subalutaceus]|uniref:uncharacterized protein n=1 Tax=Suillus subalutaceus TaxID=48586 RepID=UPI001B880D50|nr:uncharacterized protein DFJ58DRAFT_684760 [Suillus subalutaceus]KAG1851840.1 hypothetical protein DFJ58DRAFT_684760 [Suillus subalutaceus]